MNHNKIFKVDKKKREIELNLILTTYIGVLDNNVRYDEYYLFSTLVNISSWYGDGDLFTVGEKTHC